MVIVAAEKEKISYLPNRRDGGRTVLSAGLLVVVHHTSMTDPADGSTTRIATVVHPSPLQLFLFCASPKPSLTIFTLAETCFRSVREGGSHSASRGGRGGVHFPGEGSHEFASYICDFRGCTHAVNQSETPLLSK
jgi:hypothetical protein